MNTTIADTVPPEIDQKLAAIEAEFEQTEQRKAAAFLDTPATVAGMTLRPFTAASLILLKQTGNPILEGKTDAADIEFHVAAFLFIHAAPIKDVRRAAKDGDTFRDAVLDFSERLSVKDFSAAAHEAKRMIEGASTGSNYQVADDGTPNRPN